MNDGVKTTVSSPWRRLHRLPTVVGAETSELLRRFSLSRRTLLAVTRVEFQKKYSGSILGVLWHPIYSGLLLGLYCFIFMVVFPVRFKNSQTGTYDYVLIIFSGLIPYLGFSDAVATSVSSIKSNINLVKNAVFPVELLPVKYLLVSMTGLLISLGILFVMILPTSFFGWHILYLPVPFLMLVIFSLSVIWVLSAVAVLVSDLIYIINLLLLMMLFVSPIAILLEDVPARAVALMYLNPLTYLIESFRFALIGVRSTPIWLDAIFFLASALAAALAGTFFRRLMPLFSDYE